MPAESPHARRHRALAGLAGPPFDLLIIGGGSVGAAIAQRAALRGLAVALVDRGDFGSGTSSRSTKLIHGGVRYLERAVRRADMAEFRLVREGLAERAAFFRHAGFLCRAISILTPTYSRMDRLYYGLGLHLYDLLAGDQRLARTKTLSATAAKAAFPALGGDGLTGGVVYADGQFDDARLNVLLALTAQANGAVVANYTQVQSLIHASGRVAGAVVRDMLEGGELTVMARAVINAAGPLADAIRGLDDPESPPVLSVSSGTHLVLSGALCPPDLGLLLPKTRDGRVLFVLPWLGQTLVGTTDEAARPVPHPVPAPSDVDYLLGHLRQHLGMPVGRDEVRAAWCGLRPLVADPRRPGTAALARGHVVSTSASGLITVVGGKWTTYRRIAADAVDHVLRQRGQEPVPTVPPDLRILGQAGFGRPLVAAVSARHNLPADVAGHLAASYGDRMGDVAELAAAGGQLRLDPAWPYLEAEVAWAVTHELAQRPADVLARRLRLAFLDQEAALRCLPRVSALMGQALGWDARRQAREEEAARQDLLHP